MPELVRRIAGRLRRMVSDRRRSPRLKARLPVVVSLLEAEGGTEPANATGHTRDLSAEGLGLVLPNIRVGGRYLVGDSVTLRVTLKLPDAYARLYGRPVRYEKLDADDAERGFLVGLRLADTSEQDRALVAAYLKTLK